MSALVHFLAASIARLEPGQSQEVTEYALREIRPTIQTGPGSVWSGVDHIMNEIEDSLVSSGDLQRHPMREFYTRTDYSKATVTFHRLKEPLPKGRRSYVPPELIDKYRQDPDGFYTRIE